MRRPVYRLIVKETDEGMDFVGLVDDPAHSKKWITMSSAKPVTARYQFDNEKKIVRGVVLATNQLIYRRDPDGYEYDVYFSKDDSEKIRDMFATKGYHNNLNIMHNQGMKVQGVGLIEMLTIDDKRSNIPEVFADQNLQPGSLIFSYKITDPKTWQFIKTNGAGFSLEGWFSQVEVKFHKQKRTMKKSLLERLGFKTQPEKKVFDAANKDKYETATAASGETLYWEGDLAEGNTLFLIPEGGTEAEAVLASGTYEIDVEGMMMTVATDQSGVITSVTEGAGMEDSETEAAMQAMKADYEGKIEILAKSVETLTAMVEKLAEKEGFKLVSTGSDDEPAWKRMKKQQKN